MSNEIKTEDTVESLRLQIKKLYRLISLQEKRIIRAEEVMSTRDKVTDMLRAERLVQESYLKQAHEEIAEKNEHIRIMLENAPVGLTLFDENFKFVDCNEAVLKIYGVTREFYSSFFGSSSHSPEFQPDGSNSREKALEINKRVMNGETVKIEWVHCLPDGQPLPVELTMTRMKQGDKYIGLGYIYDMREQKRMREEIEAALVEAQEANQSKSNFLSNMSHEMRTPMNAIIGMTAIGMKANDIEQKNHALNKIENASSHLLGLINDVLDMAKIEANKLELLNEEFSFNAMIEKALTVIRFRVDEKQQVLTVNLDDNIPYFIIGDNQRLSQVLINLLSNAVKFTQTGGKIDLKISQVGKNGDSYELLTEVIDNGIGISPDQQMKLFGMFEQANSGMSSEYEGTGLGLAISKRIIELMGGDIWLESELGKGAKFSFKVTVKGSDQSISLENHVDNTNVDPAATNSHVFCKGKRLLAAEDMATNRYILSELLNDSGLEIDFAQNGMEAVEMVCADPDKYDIVFMDVRMPKMNGLDATRHIRALPLRQRGRLPIIAMTANAFKSDIENCLAAGMDDHLGKPLDINKVIEKLRTFLK